MISGHISLDKLDNSKKEEIADKVEEKVNGGGQDKDHVEQKGPLSTQSLVFIYIAYLIQSSNLVAFLL